MKRILISAVFAVAQLAAIATASAQAHADGDPKMVKIATQQCESAVQTKILALAQKYRATNWLHKINRVDVGSDGVYVCNVYVRAVVFEQKDEQIWSVSGHVNKASPVWFDGDFYGSKI